MTVPAKRNPADLPETFNYLIGLRVASRRRIDGVLATTGVDAENQQCLTLWRNLEEKDHRALDAWFVRNRSWFPEALDLVYVNGDQTLNAIKQPGRNLGRRDHRAALPRIDVFQDG